MATDPRFMGDTRTTFIAKYSGTCGVCAFYIEKGETIHYVGGQVAHEHCHGDNTVRGPYERAEREAAARAEPAYVKRGGRKNPMCPNCFCEHAEGAECY